MEAVHLRHGGASSICGLDHCLVWGGDFLPGDLRWYIKERDDSNLCVRELNQIPAWVTDGLKKLATCYNKLSFKVSYLRKQGWGARHTLLRILGNIGLVTINYLKRKQRLINRILLILVVIEHSRSLTTVKLTINKQNSILLCLIRPLANDGFHKVFTTMDTITDIKIQFKVNKEPQEISELKDDFSIPGLLSDSFKCPPVPVLYFCHSQMFV